MQYLVLLGWLLCLTLASPAPGYGPPVCSQGVWKVLKPVAQYAPASAYCERRFAVAAVTETITYAPTSTSISVVTVLRTVPSLSTSIVTQLVTKTTGTTYLDKREATPAAAAWPSASLSRYWKSASSALSRRGSAAFSTACSCIETPRKVKVTATAKTVIVKSTTTTTKYTTKGVAIPNVTTKTVDVLATVSPGPGSCSNVKSPYTDSSISGSSKQYNAFCKQALTPSAANIIDTLANVADFKSCIAKCSSTANCVALNYVRRTKTCTLLKDASGTPAPNDDTDSAQTIATGSNTGDSDSPISIPGVSLDSNGAYTPPNSQFSFKVATNKVFSYAASDLIKSVATQDFASCINQCATTDQCVMVSRSRSAGMCLLFQKILSTTSKLRTRQDTSGSTPADSDSAMNVIAPDQTCSALAIAKRGQLSDQQQPYQRAYNMKCNAFNPATAGDWIDRIAGTKNLQQCTDLCGQNSACIAANFYHDTFECWLANATLSGFSQVDDGITRPSQIDAVAAGGRLTATDCNTMSSGPFVDQYTFRTWNLKCGASLDPNGDTSRLISTPSTPTFKDCIYSCAKTNECTGVDYDENSLSCSQYRSGPGFQGGISGHNIAVVRQGATSSAGVNTPSSTTTGGTTQTKFRPAPTTTSEAGPGTSPADDPTAASTQTVIPTLVVGPGTSPVDGPTAATSSKTRSGTGMNTAQTPTAQADGPTTTSTTTSETPSGTPPPECRAGQQDSGSRSFEVLCNSWLITSDFTVLETTATDNMADCLSACTKHDDCVAVDLDPDQSQCLSLGNAKNYDYYFTKPGRQGTQFAMQTSPEIRACGGIPMAQTYHANNSVDFSIGCNKDIRWVRSDLVDIYSGLQTETFAQCLDVCANDFRCGAVNWLGPPDPGYTKAACNVLTGVSNSIIGSTIMAAIVSSRPPTPALTKYTPCTPHGTGELYAYPGPVAKDFQIVKLNDFAYPDEVMNSNRLNVFRKNATSWEDCAYQFAISGATYVQFDSTNSTSWNCAATWQEPHDVNAACVARPGWVSGVHPDVVL